MTPDERDRLVRLETQFAGMEKTLSDIRKDTREVRDAVMSARGGWKMLVMVGGLSAAIGGVIAKFSSFFTPT